MAPDRRRQLLRIAVQEFAGVGYERASLNRIIRACGMSKSSFYHYVDGKKALFDLVVSEAMAAMADVVAVPAPAELAKGDVDFWAQIAELSEQLLAASEEEPWFRDFGRLFHLADAPNDDGPLSQAMAGIHDWLDHALEAGRARSAVRDDLPVSLQSRLVLAVLTTMDDWSLAQGEHLTPEHRRQLTHVQIDALRRLLDP